MHEISIDSSAPILVEIEPLAGVATEVSATDLIQEGSEKAINDAMNTIYNTATRINRTIKALEVKPDQVEVEFSIKIVAEAGAIIAKTSGEANFKVKLTMKC